ncbi:hypothetical protein ACMFMG_010116 [Clarireedia jacksonii]
MGDLDGLVSQLVDIYTRSIKLLSAHRKTNRKHERVSDERDNQEARLLKSLRRSKSDVLQAYKQDLVQAGPRFSHGDAKARSSLSKILSRLDRAFMKAWESFSRGGRVRSSDRERLTQLSNESRMQALSTFDELSKRLSQSTLSSANRQVVARRGGKSRSHSTSSTTLTALGPATKEGWIRSKPHKTGHRSPKQRPQKEIVERRSRTEQPLPPTPPVAQIQCAEPPERKDTATQLRIENRKSGMSFLSASTKLGEIPRRRVAQLLAAAGHSDVEYPEPTVLYPLAPYHPEPKPRSRFGKLFKSR